MQVVQQKYKTHYIQNKLRIHSMSQQKGGNLPFLNQTRRLLQYYFP